MTRQILLRPLVAAAAILLASAAASVTVSTLPAGTPAAGAATPTQTLLFSDDFTGASGQAPNKYVWQALQGGDGWGNAELQSYTARASNVSLDGAGHLSIVARKESYKGADGITRAYTSSRLVSQVQIQYGWLEARINVPVGNGLWPAFWTVGSDIYTKGWPLCGEIDIMEATNKMTVVTGAIHGPNKALTYAYAIGGAAWPAGGLAGWHTYAINWTAAGITWYLDDVPYYTVSKATFEASNTWEFDKPHLVQLDLAVGGSAPGSPDATTKFPSTMSVDWVRVYTSK